MRYRLKCKILIGGWNCAMGMKPLCYASAFQNVSGLPSSVSENVGTVRNARKANS